jgi:peptidoglycan/LPS O-acetylase OafA/YrhL
MKYQYHIDGLRAIAVLMVIGFHAFPSIFKGGFVGVDVFFVISGYLISTNLINSLSSNTDSLLIFYQRRIRRIFPALLVVLITCYLVGYFLFTGSEFKQLGKHISAGSAFFSNIAYIQESGYFDISGDTKPLLHLWSLGVEEQFYIFLPPLLWLLWRSKINIIHVIVLLTLVSFFLNVLTTSDPTTKFYSPLTRVWELLLGTILALFQYSETRNQYLSIRLTQTISHSLEKYANIVSFVGLFAVVSSLIVINPRKDFPSWWALLPTIGTVLLIAVGRKGWVSRTLLSHPLLVWVGLISYPLYLWHWPLLSIATIIEGTRPSVWHRIIAIALTFALAVATYFWIEKPLRFGGFARFKTLFLVFLMTLVGLLGYKAYIADGYPERSFAAQFKNVSDAIEDWEGDRNLKDSNYLGHQVITNSSQKPEILMIGDSHIEQFLPRIVKLSEKGEFPPTIVMHGGGCPLIPNVREDSLQRCEKTLSSVLDVLKESTTIKKVVLGGCWNCYFLHETKTINSTDKGFNYYFTNGGKREPFRGGSGSDMAIAELEQLLKFLSLKHEVYLLLDNPFGEAYNPRNMIGNRFVFNGEQHLKEVIPVDLEQFELNERLKKIAQQAGANVIDQIAALCPEGQCLRLTTDKKPIYKDSHHLRPFFVKEQGSYLEQQLLMKKF